MPQNQQSRRRRELLRVGRTAHPRIKARNEPPVEFEELIEAPPGIWSSRGLDTESYYRWSQQLLNLRHRRGEARPDVRRITESLAGDHFYLDDCAQWQLCHGYRRASWIRSHKMLRVHLIHRGKVPHVREIHVHFHDIGERLVRGAQDCFEVLKDLLCLSGDAALNQLARDRILCDLAARVHTITVANGR
jgi:hypothetical protein